MMYVCIYEGICECMYVCTHVCMFVRMDVYMYLRQSGPAHGLVSSPASLFCLD